MMKGFCLELLKLQFDVTFDNEITSAKSKHSRELNLTVQTIKLQKLCCRREVMDLPQLGGPMWNKSSLNVIYVDKDIHTLKQKSTV